MAPTKKDGYCFIAALHECLQRDHQSSISMDMLKEKLDHEIYEHVEDYRHSYTGTTREMLAALDNYLQKGDWAQKIVDIVVIAATKCLSVNMCIFKNINNRAMYYFLPSNRPLARDIYLKYDHEHYDAIVWKGTDPIDEQTKKFFAEQGVFFQHHLPSSPVTSRPQSETDTQQSKRPTVEDLGPDDSEDEINNRNSPIDSPFKVPLVSDNYVFQPVPEQYLFEEEYSGTEDAVLHNETNTDSTFNREHNLQPRNLESEMNATRCEVQTSEDDGPFVDRITSPANLSDVTSDSMSSSVFSDSSTASHSRNRPPKYTKQKMDHSRMARCEVEKVNEIPWDIDGDHVYEVPADAENYMRKYRDGRWFVLKAGSRLGLNGYRKVGTCQGSLICTYDDCTKLTTEGVRNTYDFNRVGAHKLFKCSSCGHLAERAYCGCIKVVEYDRDRQTLRYEHQGTHICLLKPNVQERRRALESLPIPMSGSTKAKTFMQDCVRHMFENGQVKEAFKLCDDVCEADVVAKIKQLRDYPNKSVNRQDIIDSFGHIAHFQDSIINSDHDKYLLWKWECKELNGKGTYVFKTSELSIQIALKMAGKIQIGEEDSTLITEPAYFDGMHKRVRNFVTLTMWVFHPGMRGMIILSVMECPKEDTDNIELFFRNFNGALSEYLKEDNYLWDPFLLMVDEKGANFKAISRVFGENWRQTKAVTCQFHFQNCAEHYIQHIPDDEKNYFRRLCRELCGAHTREHYKLIADQIISTCDKYNFMGWWRFWSPRCPHIVPSLRGFNLPRMNLAEVGQSTMRNYRKKMWLTEASFRDIAALALQSSKFTRWVENREKLTGKGPTLKTKSQREKALERRYVDEIDDILYRGNLAAEAERNIVDPFMPSGRAKHRVSRHAAKGRQGVEDDDDDDEDEVIFVKHDRRKNPPRRKRGKNERYSPPNQKGRRAPAEGNNQKGRRAPAEGKNQKGRRAPAEGNNQKGRRAPAEGNGPDVPTVPEAIEDALMEANRVYYVVLNPNNNISRCQGCRLEIKKTDKKFPKNMVFLYKMRREVPPAGGGRWQLSQENLNCYFHASDLGCLKQVYALRDLSVGDIYMSNKNIKKLKQENVDELERRDHWEPILDNRRRASRTGSLA